MLIGRDWKIETDDMNVTISKRSIVRKGKNAGQGIRIPKVYFSSLQHALEWLVDNEVKASGLKDLQTVLAKQAELYSLIASLTKEEK